MPTPLIIITSESFGRMSDDLERHARGIDIDLDPSQYHWIPDGWTPTEGGAAQQVATP